MTHYFAYVKAEEWEFVFNQYGRPELSSKHKINFYFNLSHSATRAFIICSSFPLCGIDVEDIKKMEYSPELLNMVLSKKEEKSLRNTSNKDKLFFSYWTLKEAHLKALGKGFSISPKEISFEALDTFKTQMYIKDENSYYGLFYSYENYLMSFAVLNQKEVLEASFFTIEDL